MSRGTRSYAQSGLESSLLSGLPFENIGPPNSLSFSLRVETTMYAVVTAYGSRVKHNTYLRGLCNYGKFEFTFSTFRLYVYMLRDLKFRLADHKYFGEFESAHRSGFRPGTET